MKVVSESNLARIMQINIREKKLDTPCFFPSISSYGLKIPLKNITEIVEEYKPPRVLVSCYDLEKYDESFSFLTNYKGVKFFDSGLFESYWLKDADWTFQKYLDIINESEPDIYTSFDYIPEENIKSKLYFENTSRLIDDSDVKEDSLFLPVIHPNEKVNILTLTSKIMQKYGDKIKGFSISEKDLGYNIINKIKNIKAIKKIISKSNQDLIIHMLGCGHPINMLIYSSLGIDLFDSRSWLNSVINDHNLMQYPFSYLEGIDCNCDICNNTDMDYVAKALLHNIITYEKITNSIKEWIENDEIYDILQIYIYENKILSEITKE